MPSGFKRADHVAGLVVILGRAAQAMQIIGSQDGKAFHCHAPRHILDVRIKAAIFMDDDDAGIFAFGAWLHKVAGAAGITPESG